MAAYTQARHECPDTRPGDSRWWRRRGATSGGAAARTLTVRAAQDVRVAEPLRVGETVRVGQATRVAGALGSGCIMQSMYLAFAARTRGFGRIQGGPAGGVGRWNVMKISNVPRTPSFSPQRATNWRCLSNPAVFCYPHISMPMRKYPRSIRGLYPRPA